MWLFYSLAAEARFQEGPFGGPGSMQCKYTPPGNEESTCDTELLNTYVVRTYIVVVYVLYTYIPLFSCAQYTVLGILNQLRAYGLVDTITLCAAATGIKVGTNK